MKYIKYDEFVREMQEESAWLRKRIEHYRMNMPLTAAASIQRLEGKLAGVEGAIMFAEQYMVEIGE